MASPSAASPHLEIDDHGIAHVIFDDPERSANVLTEAVMRRLEDVQAEIESGAQDETVKGVLFRSGKSSFIVGADVDAIARIESPLEGAEAAREGQALYLAIERLPIPTVAAINGTCMGGGTELALACRYRLISDAPGTKMGLPEVQLGILPAWGGTTRLPRLIGLQAALDLLLTGKTVDGRKARRLGLVEDVLPASTFASASEAFLRERIGTEGKLPTGADRSFFKRIVEDTAPGRAIILRTARSRVMDRTGGHYPAPLKIIDVLSKSAGRSVEKALEYEALAAGELIASRVSRSLIHVFHMREAARKGTGVEGEVDPREVSEMAVLGAGVMGGGIAQLAAYNGIRVRMKDIRHDAVASGLRYARSLFDKAAERRKISSREADQAMDLISGSLEYTGFAQLDLVVEAVVEKMGVKRTVLAEAEALVPEGCVMTTNTSTLSVDEMAEALERPRDFCGMHFFNPVHKMPLVEVVRGKHSSDRAIATVYALSLRLGKVPIVVNDGPGFLVNRILGPYLNEAGHLLAEGASVESIDRAATEFGMPMGPLRLVDEVGIDIARHAGEVLYEAFGDRMKPSGPLVSIGETDRLGTKGGLGFYRYENGKEQGVDPDVYGVLGDAVPSERRTIPEEDIRARLVLMMMNEASRVLDDGVAASAADVDLAMIMGTGFPPFRGGLLRFADELHPRLVVERLREYEAEHGERFAPSSLLLRLASSDQRFYEAFPAPER